MSEDKKTDVSVYVPRLPERQKTNDVPARGGSGLSHEHKGKLIDAGVRILSDAGDIARQLVEIQKIKIQSEAKVNEIDAYTQQQVALIQSKVHEIMASNDGVRARGEAIRGIIREISEALYQLPESDEDSRKSLIAYLPNLAELAVKG